MAIIKKLHFDLNRLDEWLENGRIYPIEKPSDYYSYEIPIGFGFENDVCTPATELLFGFEYKHDTLEDFYLSFYNFDTEIYDIEVTSTEQMPQELRKKIINWCEKTFKTLCDNFFQGLDEDVEQAKKQELEEWLID